MKIQVKNKLQFILVIIVLIIFLFPKNVSIATSTTDSTKRNYQRGVFSQLASMLGDGIQILIDSLGTNTSLKKNWDLLYPKSDIEDGNLQEEIEARNANSKKKLKNNILKEVSIASKIDGETGEDEEVYTTETKIPVIPIDIYSVFAGIASSTKKIELFDIDFLNPSNNNSNKAWKFLRSVVSTSSRIVLYLSSALLMSMLILRAIMFVKSSLGDAPDVAAESRRAMDNWIKAIILVVGVYLIAEIMIYFYQMIFNTVMDGYKSNYLIRVTVDDVYSFNTNLIGWIKYKSITSSYLVAFGWSIMYLIMAIVDLICFFFMFLRTLVVGLLIILAPFTAVMSMSERTPREGAHFTNILHFKSWIKIFTCSVWTPMIMIIVQRILLSL